MAKRHILGLIKQWTLLILSGFLAITTPTIVHAEDTLLTPPMLISEIQTGGLVNSAEAPKQEFIELYNNSAGAVDLTGWRLEFLTKDHDGLSPPTRTFTTLEGTIEPTTFLVVSYAGYLSDAAAYFSGGPTSGYLPKNDGTVRLLDAQGSVIDLLGYGTPTHYRSQPAKAPSPGHSLQRCTAASGDMLNTNHNFNDFAIYTKPTPIKSVLCPSTEPEPSEEGEIGASPTSCEKIEITEILPNPEGTDTGKEYIELHNSTNVSVSLSGCALQTSTSNKIFQFTDVSLAPNEYRAWSDTHSGLILPNTNGGTVWLLNGTTELADVNYAANPEDGMAWAYFHDGWRSTYTPTQGSANIFTAHKPCPSSQIRNPETGRCTQPNPTTIAPAPCKPGQERNPSTNRCRAVLGATSLARACGPDQHRNPETNRCKKITTATTLQPCAPNQERNSATNRCRKVESATGTRVEDIPSQPSANLTGWSLAGMGVMGALGYGAYEWRREIGSGLARIKQKIIPSSSDP